MNIYDRMPITISLVLTTSALCSTLSACHDKASLECPVPQLHSSRGDLRESADDIRSYQNRFASGFSGNVIPDAIGSLLAKYPDAGKPAIENYLVAAYCPVAASHAVGVADQKAKLANFERAVRADLGH